MDFRRPFSTAVAPQRALARRRCILHAGSPKTATSSIQSVLQANRERFLADGFLVPRSGQTASGSHRYLAFSLAGLPVPGDGKAADRKLEREVADCDAGTVLISSEFLWTILAKQDQAERLFARLGSLGFDVTVLIYVRNQPQFLNSMYQHDANFRRQRTFPAYAATARRNPGRYAYSRWLDFARLHSVPLLVRPFSAEVRRQGVVEDFLTAIGVPSARGYETAVELRRSVGPFTVAVAQCLMRHIGDARRLTEEQTSSCRHALRDELRRRRIIDHGYCGLTTGLAAEIEQLFSEDNGRLAEFAWGRPWDAVFGSDIGQNFEPNDYAVTGIPEHRRQTFDEVLASLGPKIDAILSGSPSSRVKPQRWIPAALKSRLTP